MKTRRSFRNNGLLAAVLLFCLFGNGWATLGFPDWTHTARIALDPINCTETNSYVKLKIDFEDSMRTDFRDLRFYNSGGDTVYAFAQVTDETVAGDSSVWWIRLNTRRAEGDTMWVSFCNFTADSVTWETEDELIAGEYTTTEAPLVEVPISGLVSSHGWTEQTWFWPYQWRSGIKEYQVKVRTLKTGNWPDFFTYGIFVGLGGNFANCAGAARAGEETWYLDGENNLVTINEDASGLLANWLPIRDPSVLVTPLPPDAYTLGGPMTAFGSGGWGSWATILIRQTPRGTVYIGGNAYYHSGWETDLTKCIIAVSGLGHTSFPDVVCKDCDDSDATLQLEATILTHYCAPDSTVEQPTMEIPVSTDPDAPKEAEGDFIGVLDCVGEVCNGTGTFIGTFDGDNPGTYTGGFVGSFDGTGSGTEWSGDFDGFFVGAFVSDAESGGDGSEWTRVGAAKIDTSAYLIRLSDSTYTALLRGQAATRTAGISIPGAWSHNQRAHEFSVGITGQYDLWFDPLGGVDYSRDTDWSKALGKFIPGPDITDLMAQLDLSNRVVSTHLGNVADSSGQGMIAPGTAGETLVKGDWLYVKSDGKYWKGNATDSTKMPIVAICLSNALEDSAIDVLWDGVFRRDSDTYYNKGMFLYMGLTDGTPTETPPNDQSKACAVILTDHIIHFKPSFRW